MGGAPREDVPPHQLHFPWHVRAGLLCHGNHWAGQERRIPNQHVVDPAADRGRLPRHELLGHWRGHKKGLNSD